MTRIKWTKQVWSNANLIIIFKINRSKKKIKSPCVCVCGGARQLYECWDLGEMSSREGEKMSFSYTAQLMLPVRVRGLHSGGEEGEWGCARRCGAGGSRCHVRCRDVSAVECGDGAVASRNLLEGTGSADSHEVTAEQQRGCSAARLPSCELGSFPPYPGTRAEDGVWHARQVQRTGLGSGWGWRGTGQGASSLRVPLLLPPQL